MSNKRLTGICPVCDAQVTPGQDVTISEVVSCPDCKSRLVVDNTSKQKITLSEAPNVEEDWGE